MVTQLITTRLKKLFFWLNRIMCTANKMPLKGCLKRTVFWASSQLSIDSTGLLLAAYLTGGGREAVSPQPSSIKEHLCRVGVQQGRCWGQPKGIHNTDIYFVAGGEDKGRSADKWFQTSESKLRDRSSSPSTKCTILNINFKRIPDSAIHLRTPCTSWQSSGSETPPSSVEKGRVME